MFAFVLILYSVLDVIKCVLINHLYTSLSNSAGCPALVCLVIVLMLGVNIDLLSFLV